MINVVNSHQRLINLGLRGATLLSRFIFIFLLAKCLPPAEVGLYGLFTAAVGYALFFVGVDFYVFSTREVAKTNDSGWGMILKNHIGLAIVLYLTVVPVGFVLFFTGALPWALAPFFFLLLIAEHLCQELMRFFIAASRQLVASVILFLRQALWAIVAALLFLADNRFQTLNFVLLIWLLSALVAIVAGVCVIIRMNLGGWNSRLNFAWIKSGLKVALPLLIATLALRGINTFDRYWLESLVGIEVVATYVLFLGVAATLLAFLDAGVFSFAYPDMINAFENNDVVLYREKVRGMVLLTTCFSIGFTVASCVALPYLLGWLDKAVYFENQGLYKWLLAGTVVNALSLIPHFGLYAQKLDKPIVQSHILSLFVFFFATYIVSLHSVYLAVPVGILVSQVFVLIWKTVAYTMLSAPSYAFLSWRSSA